MRSLISLVSTKPGQLHAVSMTVAESRVQWIELAVYAGVAFLLVAAR
ncbi:hypothetical protein [Streptosporangium subroseum]|nr:hypothetical protein OHB15_07955 [Streptosporangium subroseum]